METFAAVVIIHVEITDKSLKLDGFGDAGEGGDGESSFLPFLPPSFNHKVF